MDRAIYAFRYIAIGIIPYGEWNIFLGNSGKIDDGVWYRVCATEGNNDALR